MLAHGALPTGYILTTAIIIPFTLIAFTDGAIAKQTESKSVASNAAAFEFAYETKDEAGNLQMHREQQDVLGRRIGTYGYRHANGIYRFVDYIADSLGYRATIRTNEPGTRTTLGAHVTVEAAPSPPDTAQRATVHPNSFRRFAPKAVATAGKNSIITQALSKRPHTPLPLIVVPSPVPISRPVVPIVPRSSLDSAARSEADEVPRVPEEPGIVEVVHAADVVQPRRRQPLRIIDPALLFPAPPLIRPPRYRPRGGKFPQQGVIEAAFRKRRS